MQPHISSHTLCISASAFWPRSLHPCLLTITRVLVPPGQRSVSHDSVAPAPCSTVPGPQIGEACEKAFVYWS